MEKRKTQIIVVGIALLLVTILLVGIVLVSNSSHSSTKEKLNENHSSTPYLHKNVGIDSVFVPWNVQVPHRNCRGK